MAGTITVRTDTNDFAASVDTFIVYIDYPNPLGNPLQVNERWDDAFIKAQYVKYLTMKIMDKDKAIIDKLDAIAEHVMAGNPVILVQGPKDVHGQYLADFILENIR